MRLGVSIYLLFFYITLVISEGVIYNTNVKRCPYNVVCDIDESFLFISTTSDEYNEFVIGKNRLITINDFFIYKALVFTYKDYNYIVIYCKNSKNQYKVFPYKLKNDQLDKINLSITKDVLDDMKKQIAIKDEIYNRVTEYYLPKSSPSLTCPNFKSQEFLGEFLNLKPMFEYVEIDTLDLDSEADIQTYGIVVNKTKEFTLFYVKELFSTNKIFSRVKKGLFSINFDTTLYRFISLKVINNDLKQIEVLSINEQGYNTLIFDPNANFKQTFDIPRTQYLPNNTYSNYLVLDLLNHEPKDFSGIIDVEYYYSYIIYKIINNEYTVVVQCKNIDVYLPSDESNRQIHVQLSNSELYSVTTISNKDGKVITRSFLKSDDSLYTFRDILSQVTID